MLKKRFRSISAKTMKGCSNRGTGGQWIDVWELLGAAWMLIGQEIYSLMKPIYDSFLRLPATQSTITIILFSSFYSCSVVTSLLSSGSFSHLIPLTPLPSHPRLHNLFYPVFLFLLSQWSQVAYNQILGSPFPSC